MSRTSEAVPVGDVASRRGAGKWFGLAGWILICFAATLPATQVGPDDWYAGLNHPAFAPPDWVFGPVWSILYLSMAVAAWRVWLRGTLRDTGGPLTLFAVQLVLNAAWTWFFFGLHRIDLALIDICLLIGTIAVTIGLFFRRDRIAGLLLVPYLGWVLFAAVLNFEYWRLNP